MCFHYVCLNYFTNGWKQTDLILSSGGDAPKQSNALVRLCSDSPTRFTGLTSNRPSKVLEIKRFLICARLGARAYCKFTPPAPACRGGWRAYNLTDTDLFRKLAPNMNVLLRKIL
jgi:hypothetical protein